MSRKSLLGLLIASGVILVGVLMFVFLISPEVELPSEQVAIIPAEVTPLDTPEPVVDPIEEPVVVAPTEEIPSTPFTGGIIEVELILFGLGVTSFGTGLAVVRRKRK